MTGARVLRGLPPSRPFTAQEKGYPCPTCGMGAIVVDSRKCDEGIRRRRACTDCGGRFTTYEIVGKPPPPPQDARDVLIASLLAKITAHYADQARG